MENAEKWKLDMEGFSLWGGSAGGHLAAWYAAEAPQMGLPQPGTLVLAYPVITMGEGTHPGSRNFLLGKNVSQEMLARMSMENRVTPGYPATYLWWGEADSIVDPVNSCLMEAALEKNGVPYVAKSWAGVDHGVGIGRGLACEGWFEEAVKFWKDHQ